MKRRTLLLASAFLVAFLPGTAAASGLESLLSGEELPCEARDGKSGQRWPCVIRITSHDSATGAIAGEVTWSTLGAVHRIEGRSAGQSLTFRETGAIRAGSAHLNVEYTMTVSGAAVAGTYVDHTDGGKGTATITLPAADTTGEVELSRLSGSALLVSGKVFPCESRDAKSKKRWLCKISMKSQNVSTGAIVGQLTWTQSTAIHRIEGKLVKDRLSFTETKAIRKGAETLKSTYSLKVEEGKASGTFTDPVNRASGTMLITLR